MSWSNRTAWRRPSLTVVAVILAVLSLLACGGGPSTSAAPRLPAEIRVALIQGHAQATVSATAQFQVVDRSNGQVVLTAGAWEQVQLKASLGLLYVNETGPYHGPLTVRLVNGASGRVATLGRQYRGWFDVLIGADRQLLVVSQVGLEDYLMGVVPREMPASWHPEALKAQAIAARTYAVSQIRGAEARDAPFAVVATTDSQVYGGSGGEVATSNNAVMATRGMILTHQGQPILAVYHASSGGHTENCEIVWSGSHPYLVGVPDYDQWSPRHTWQVIMTPEEVSRRLAAAGHTIGTITSIEQTGARGVSGRTHSWTIRGALGSVELRSEAARRTVGLWSSLVEITMSQDQEGNVVTSLPRGREVTVVGASGGATQTVASSVGQSFSIGTEGILYKMSRITVIHRAQVIGAVQFDGHGWGHGVGMSQHGAYAMAMSGNTYDQILAHYYRGAVLEQR